MVGEMVINQSMLKQYIAGNTKNESNLDRTISQMEGITTNIKNLVLSMGMVPIAEIFNKLRVVVRNTALELNKSVLVQIQGEETELDRNVIQSIYDPLVHIVRNSIDHGIENSEEREKSGKDRMGKIIISAEHKGNGIEINVLDDGKGIQKDIIIKKAVSLGLAKEEEINELTDKAIYNFMFLPGFSTAEKVTEISGRGVGLDVVKKNIDEIRGKIEINSKPGEYTKFVIKLPLTLAIIEGFVTQIGANRYIFPFSVVEEIIVPKGENVNKMEDGDMMLFHRGNYIPVIFAGKIFKQRDFIQTIDQMVVLIINYDGKNYGIVVDKVLGKQETVIKNLSEMLSNVIVFSGGTIFGDGQIGFVVDIEGFLGQAQKNN
jgi:two-component system chemotaxis sensor kinase CheA